MGVAFAACDNYEEPNPQPQTNPQAPVLKTDEVALASSLATDTYDLAALSEAGEKIVLAVVEAPDLGPQFTYSAEVQISKNNFATAGTVPCTLEALEGADNAYQLSVTPDDLQGIYYSTISKGPKTKEVSVRYALYTQATAGSMTTRIGGDDNYYGPFAMTLTPFPTSLVLEDNYYLVGTACDWTVAQAIKLNHSDASVYDDPMFSYKFDVYEGWWWKIIPESTFVTGDWASGPNSQFGVEVNGDDALAGVLVAATAEAEPEAGCLNVSGSFLLTINVEDMTYEFSPAFDNLYTPGNSNGWSQTASQLLATVDYSNYFGFAHLNGDYKFSSQANWDGTNYGAAGEGELSTDGGAGNLSAPADGLYWCTANITSLTYAIVPVETIGIIGDATEQGWDASTALTPDETFLVWTGKVTLKEGSFKFRCNDSWDLNMGGELDCLITNAEDGNPANITSPGAGEYTVTLYLNQLPYTAVLTK